VVTIAPFTGEINNFPAFNTCLRFNSPASTNSLGREQPRRDGMMVVPMTSKITSKGQTTPGEGDTVRVRKAEPFDPAWHRALSPTLAEWDSTNDHENFDDL
jgi:hypothetical protein